MRTKGRPFYDETRARTGLERAFHQRESDTVLLN